MLIFLTIYKAKFESLLLSEGKQKDMGQGRGKQGELGGGERGKTVVRMYYKREESIFNYKRGNCEFNLRYIDALVNIMFAFIRYD